MWMGFWILFMQFAIPFGILALTLFIVSRSELGRAVTDRWRGSGADRAALDELNDEVAHLTERLCELEERFDFTERILAAHGSKDRSGSDAVERIATPV